MPADPLPAIASRAWGKRDGRWLMLSLLVAQLGGFFYFSPRYNDLQVARRWGVLTLQPVFSDLTFIAAAGATHRAGGNPYVANTFDPLNRAYNYPPLWLYLGWPAMVSSDTIRVLAILMGVLATAALLWFLGPIDRARGLVLGLLAAAPPVLLAAQRANADILMLGLVAAALVFLRRERRGLGYACLMTATWLKLYPLLTLAVLWREPRDRLRRVAPIVVGAALLCFLVYAPYLKQIFANTPAGGLHSYGARVAAFWAAFFLPAQGWNVDSILLGRICSLVAVALALLAWRVGRRAEPPPETLPASELDGFRAGAAVYVFTFLAGVSFDYRLLFLLLCVPYLMSWAAAAAPGRRWALVAVVLIFGVMWPNGLFSKPLIFVKEASSWALFFVLTALLVRTLPRPLTSRD